MRGISLRNFNGIGDLLFVTASLPLIKELDPTLHIHVNTLHPQLLEGNPFVATVGNKREGFYISYPDPWNGVNPTQHHILAVKDCLANHYKMPLATPELKPLLYINPLYPKSDRILVQMNHKRQWGAKKVWPYFENLSRVEGFVAFKQQTDERTLVRKIMAAPAIVCAEGGLSHIAKAVGTPAIVVYGGWADPSWNGYEDQVNVTNVISCSPCYNRSPCANELRCLYEISVETVANAARSFIGRKT